MKNLKQIFTIVIMLFVITASGIFAQGNFTTEWESPADQDFYSIFKLNASSELQYALFTSGTDIKIYNCQTHALSYTWTNPVSNSSGIYGIKKPTFGGTFQTNTFDVNGDGFNEIVIYNYDILGSTIKIINPQNGNVLFTSDLTDTWSFIDVDNDGYVELVTSFYNESTQNHQMKIISTPAQTVSVNEQSGIIKDYELKQNYPNPFNPNTIIEYNINKNSAVKVVIFDILGKEIKTLVDTKQTPGSYKVNLQGSNLSSGTYFYSLIVDGMAETKKMILVK